MSYKNDPIGLAIHDYIKDGTSADIIVQSDLCEDDVIPVSHFFRTYNEMPEFEQIALNQSKGNILDLGAAAGCHSKWLKSKNKKVLALDKSEGAIDYLKSQSLDCQLIDIMEYHGSSFDTILALMNGIGIAGSLENLPNFLLKLKELLNPDGRIYCDSTDISYMFQEEDGSVWVNLNKKYHGEMMFKIKYKEIESDWFSWLYIDFTKLKEEAMKVGLDCQLIKEDENNSYLAELKYL